MNESQLAAFKQAYEATKSPWGPKAGVEYSLSELEGYDNIVVICGTDGSRIYLNRHDFDAILAGR